MDKQNNLSLDALVASICHLRDLVADLFNNGSYFVKICKENGFTASLYEYDKHWEDELIASAWKKGSRTDGSNDTLIKEIYRQLPDGNVTLILFESFGDIHEYYILPDLDIEKSVKPPIGNPKECKEVMEQGFFSKGEIVLGGHFPVSVISRSREDVGKLLALYQDNNVETCPKKYLEFIYAEHEYEKEENARTYATFHDFVTDCGYAFDTDHNAYGRWENSDAKWDWYQIGGQFEGLIPLKSGGRASCCRIGEADLQKSDAAWKKSLRYWDENVAPEGKLDASVRERYLKCYGNGRKFADMQSHFFTGAFVTPDGNWRQIGKNGKLQEDTSPSDVDNYYYFFLKIFQDVPPDYWLTVVDCHM